MRFTNIHLALAFLLYASCALGMGPTSMLRKVDLDTPEVCIFDGEGEDGARILRIHDENAQIIDRELFTKIVQSAEWKDCTSLAIQCPNLCLLEDPCDLLPNVWEISINGPTKLNELRFAKITHINFFNCESTPQITAVKLKKITIRKCSAFDGRTVLFAPELEKITISHCDNIIVPALATLRKVTLLEGTAASHEFWESLRVLPGLTHLKLLGTEIPRRQELVDLASKGQVRIHVRDDEDLEVGSTRHAGAKRRQPDEAESDEGAARESRRARSASWNQTFTFPPSPVPPPTVTDEPESALRTRTSLYNAPIIPFPTEFRDGLAPKVEDLINTVLHVKRFFELGTQPAKYYTLISPSNEQKLELAQIIATRAGAPLLYLNVTKTTPGQDLEAIFNQATRLEHATGIIVFIDNADEIITTPPAAGGATPQVNPLTAALKETIARYDASDIFVFAAVQRQRSALMFKDLVSTKFQSILIGPPGILARQNILEKYLSTKGCYKHAADSAHLSELCHSLASQTESFMPSELRDIIDKALTTMILQNRPIFNDDDISSALSAIKSRPRLACQDASRFCSGQRPDTKLTDIVGQVPEEVTKVINFIKYPTRYGERAPRGILFVGPPGTGKTMLARAVAHEVDATFFPIKASDMVSKWLGDCARNIRDLFMSAQQTAEQTEKPAIIFFDEFDSIGKKRSTADGECNKERADMVNTLLALMDGFEEKKNIFVIAATNHAQSLDPAFRSRRFDFRIPIGRPLLVARATILEHYLHREKYTGTPEQATTTCRQLAERTGGFAPADLEGIIRNAAFLAVNPTSAPEDDRVTDALLRQEWGKIRRRLPEMTEEQITAETEALTQDAPAVQTATMPVASAAAAAPAESTAVLAPDAATTRATTAFLVGLLMGRGTALTTNVEFGPYPFDMGL